MASGAAAFFPEVNGNLDASLLRRYVGRKLKLRLCMLLLVLGASLLGGGCALKDPRLDPSVVYVGERPAAKEATRANFDDVSYWDDAGISGSASIRISLSEQRAYFYKGGELVAVSALSSGREGFGSPTGSFKVLEKSRDHKSSLYGDYVDASGNVIRKDVDVSKDPKPSGAKFDGAKMPFFMRVSGGVGLHEGFLPGYPASHGCIRMPGFMAQKFFDNVSVGSPVVIAP